VPETLPTVTTLFFSKQMNAHVKDEIHHEIHEIRQGGSSKIKKKIKFTNTDWSQFFERYLEAKKSTCYPDKTDWQQKGVDFQLVVQFMEL